VLPIGAILEFNGLLWGGFPLCGRSLIEICEVDVGGRRRSRAPRLLVDVAFEQPGVLP